MRRLIAVLAVALLSACSPPTQVSPDNGVGSSGPVWSKPDKYGVMCYTRVNSHGLSCVQVTEGSFKE